MNELIEILLLTGLIAFTIWAFADYRSKPSFLAGITKALVGTLTVTIFLNIFLKSGGVPGLAIPFFLCGMLVIVFGIIELVALKLSRARSDVTRSKDESTS